MAFLAAFFAAFRRRAQGKLLGRRARCADALLKGMEIISYARQGINRRNAAFALLAAVALHTNADFFACFICRFNFK
jgi:hypothetical protein